jgi:hypothetical protein
VWVAVVAYDASGQVVGLRKWEASDPLQPAGRLPFAVTVFSLGPAIARVDAVVEVPFGCLPHECYGEYEPDFQHMDFYVKLMMGKGPEGVKEYLDKFVFGPESWNDYLEMTGFKNILQAMVMGRRVYND